MDQLEENSITDLDEKNNEMMIEGKKNVECSDKDEIRSAVIKVLSGCDWSLVPSTTKWVLFFN